MDIWCQHVKWKKPSQHCLKCLLDEVERLKAENQIQAKQIVDFSAIEGCTQIKNKRLREALEELQKKLIEPFGPAGQEACRQKVQEALKDSK